VHPQDWQLSSEGAMALVERIPCEAIIARNGGCRQD
jgi:hypothetical protein